jgi:hypothetical protein
MRLPVYICIVVATFMISVFPMDFIHPGALSSKSELDFVKGKIQSGENPWKSEFDRMVTSDAATRTPHALTYINSKSNDSVLSRDDAIAAYTDALLWYFTGNESYARRSIDILNAWAELKGFTSGSDQDRLQAGWIGSTFAQAAEIMRLYPGWSAKQVSELQKMFHLAFYPKLNTASSWNGNVDLTQIDAMMSIAVFNDDEVEFDKGLERLKRRTPAYFYLTSDGTTPHPIEGDQGDLEKFWSHPAKWVDGLTQETCRDNGHHAQFGIGSALHAAEVAWHQGVDIYSENKNRYTASMEMLASQFLSGSMEGVSLNDVPTQDRYDTWEIGYNHYHNRMGINLPKTKQLILEQIRPRASRAVWNLDYETLTHGDLPNPGASPSL